MKSVRSVINKNLKMLLIVAAVTAVALGGLLLLITGNQERDQVTVEPPSAASESESTEAETETSTEEAQSTQANISQRAQNLFAAKVDSLEDSAAVAQLLETIDLRKNVAAYTVRLQLEEEPKGMTITFDETVADADKDSFDQNMQQYAELILALVADAQEVQWTYTLRSNGSNEEVTVYLNEQQATDLLKNSVKQYGESAEMVQALLNQQQQP